MRRFLNYISLSTPLQRVVTWGILTIAIFLVDFRWLEDVSLYKRLGLTWIPSIGLTRAYWLLIHGDPVAAWHMNKLLYAVVLVGAVILARDVKAILSSRTAKRRSDNYEPGSDSSDG